MEQKDFEVMFVNWCKKCVHRNLDEKMDPCNECLEQPYNENTTKPIYFEEA